MAVYDIIGEDVHKLIGAIPQKDEEFVDAHFIISCFLTICITRLIQERIRRGAKKFQDPSAANAAPAPVEAVKSKVRIPHGESIY